MRTHVDVDPREGAYRVWCWERRGDAIISYYTKGGRLLLKHVGGLDNAPPTFVLPYEVADALMEAYNPGLNPGNALSDALADARQVRDRLLSLVEGQLTSTS